MKHPTHTITKNPVSYLAAVAFVLLLGGCADSPALSFSEESSAARVKQLLARAYEHMMRKEDAAAERALLDARRLEPANSWVALDLGVIYQRRGQVEMARTEYRKVLASPANDASAASVSGTIMNGAEVKKIAQYNLETLGNTGSKSGATATAYTMPDAAFLNKPKDIARVSPTEHAVADTKTLQLAIEGWRSAWEKRDIEAYLKHYQRDFHGTKPDREAWEAYRRNQINGATGRIALQLKDMRVIRQDDEAIVSFTQHYRTDNFTDAGNKELSLIRVGDNWLIRKEVFTPAGK